MGKKDLFKVKVQSNILGIERSLPYQIEEREIADEVARQLNVLLPEFNHVVEEITSQPIHGTFIHRKTKTHI